MLFVYLANCKVVYGCSRRLAPPTNAASHSPFLIALYAESNAYILLLQAVSIKNDGPHKPKQYEIRLANIARLQLFTEKGNIIKYLTILLLFFCFNWKIRKKGKNYNVPSDSETRWSNLIIEKNFFRFNKTSTNINASFCST